VDGWTKPGVAMLTVSVVLIDLLIVLSGILLMVYGVLFTLDAIEQRRWTKRVRAAEEERWHP
jgi:hypothetical protein